MRGVGIERRAPPASRPRRKRGRDVLPCAWRAAACVKGG